MMKNGQFFINQLFRVRIDFEGEPLDAHLYEDRDVFSVLSRFFKKLYCPEIVPLVEAGLSRASAIQASWSLESGFAYSG